jgi:oligoendopeptidase F
MSEIPAIVTELLTLRHWAEAACDTEVRRAVHAHLGDRLCDLVFRQAAIARFEESAYRARAEGTLLEAETLDELWLDALRPAHEPLVEIPDSYRSAWAYVPHLFSRPFYNHTYCLAALTSLLLLERRDENPAEFEAIYRGLLGTGDSADPASQLRACGVELTSQDTWERALGCFARAVHRGPASRLPGCPGP